MKLAIIQWRYQIISFVVHRLAELQKKLTKDVCIWQISLGTEITISYAILMAIIMILANHRYKQSAMVVFGRGLFLAVGHRRLRKKKYDISI